MKNKKTLVILVVLFIIAFVYTEFSEGEFDHTSYEIPHGNLTVSFLDVGQGDCEFIEFPNGKCMLIDASVSDMGDRILNYIAKRDYKRIDYVVATHPHADHIGGMEQVLKSVEVGEVYMPPAVTTTKTFEDLLFTIKEQSIPLKKAKNGVILTEDDVKIEFLGPVSDDYDDLNNWSAVLKITFGETRFLFTGDAEELAERELIKTGKDLKTDVLKVAHHGSDSSSSPEFLKKAEPEIAVIECGKDNEYGHPHDEVIQRLEAIGAKIYRTDKDKDVVITSDGTEAVKL